MEGVHVLWLGHTLRYSSYLKHFFLFVYGVYNLMGDKIAHSKVGLAESCLKEFLWQMEVLYGLSSCTFNIHK